MINRGYTMGERLSALVCCPHVCKHLAGASSGACQCPATLYVSAPLLLVVAAGVGGMDQAPPIKIKPQAEGKVRHIAAHHSPAADVLSGPQH